MSDITYKTSWTGDPNVHPISSFSESMTGSCLCGSITVTIHDTELFTKPRGHLCHCSNCRKISGSILSSNLAIERTKVSFSDAHNTLKTYPDTDTGSGKCVRRLFCGTCGCPVMSQPEIFPHMWMVKMGMFPRIPRPECESFVAHRQEWEIEGKGEGEGRVRYRFVRGRERLGEE